MLRTVFLRSSLLAMLLIGLVAAASQADLLTNEGFETGDTTGWNVSGAGWYVNTWDQRSGTYGVVDNIESTDTGEWHVIDQYVAATPGQVFTANVWLKTACVTTTAGWLEVQFLDSSLSTMWAYGSQSTHVTADNAYQQLTLSNLTTPTGAAYIDVRGVVDRVSAPTGTNYFCFDDFSLTTVPEPATTTILVTGLIGMMAYAWRKRRS